MERDKVFFRSSLLLFFDMKKTTTEAHRLLVETYNEQAPTISTCEYWFRRFKNGNFNLNDKERTGQPKKFEDFELQALLEENSAQTLKQLAESLNVGKSTISDRLHAMGKIHKEGKWVARELPDSDSKS